MAIIYLDANLLRYVAAYTDYIMGYTKEIAVFEQRLLREIEAMRQLVELDQLGDFVYASSPMLMHELMNPKISYERRELYQMLVDSWTQSGEEIPDNFEEKANEVERGLRELKLEDTDRRHLAEAIVLNASWLLSNDSRFVENCRGADLPLNVSYPSESISELSKGLFLR